MNINPATNGHLLILPKEHYVNLFDLDENILNHSIKVIKEKLLKEEEFKYEYEKLKPRYEVISQIIEARSEQNIKQETIIMYTIKIETKEERSLLKKKKGIYKSKK